MQTDERRLEANGLSVFIGVYPWLKLVLLDFFSFLLDHVPFDAEPSMRKLSPFETAVLRLVTSRSCIAK